MLALKQKKYSQNEIKYQKTIIKIFIENSYNDIAN